MTNSEIPIKQGLAIPESEISFRFSTSSGPGGQHANKSETRVTLLFDVAQSPSLTEAQRALIMQRLGSRLDSTGVLQISVQDSRSQHKNRETAVARFQSLLAAALVPRKKRRKTRPSRAATEKRLQSKKRRSQIKRDRGRDWSS
jgi:ribosome-associated protein